MNEHAIRQELHAIFNSHAEMLLAIRTSHTAMQQAFEGHDAALVVGHRSQPPRVEATQSADG
jgi:hypothetical protein